jgi:hypothetical protein
MDSHLAQLEERILSAEEPRERLTAMLDLLSREPNYFEQGNNSNRLLGIALKDLITSLLGDDSSSG